MPYRSTSVAVECWRELPFADHAARSVGASPASGPSCTSSSQSRCSRRLPSGGLDDVGVVQEIVAGDLLNLSCRCGSLPARARLQRRTAAAAARLGSRVTGATREGVTRR